jgi:hypothetical protein
MASWFKELSASNNTLKESDYEITFASRKGRCHSCLEALRNDLNFQTVPLGSGQPRRTGAAALARGIASDILAGISRREDPEGQVTDPARV